MRLTPEKYLRYTELELKFLFGHPTVEEKEECHILYTAFSPILLKERDFEGNEEEL